MGTQFEASANLEDWPPNQPGKPTQAAVFGAVHAERGKVFEILWTAQFPDLQPAMYWAAKKEVEAVRKGDWIMASRILWQHDLTPEQALAGVRKVMEPQIDSQLRQLAAGVEADDLDLGDGPMQPVDYSNVDGVYVELSDVNNPKGDAIASFFGAPPKWDDEDENNVPLEWEPTKPR